MNSSKSFLNEHILPKEKILAKFQVPSPHGSGDFVVFGLYIVLDCHALVHTKLLNLMTIYA